jgi:glycerophosphoryl diester phosphodiesterase
MTRSAFIVIAHRGASSYAPENTFAAFDLAIRMGVHHIELDVEATSDGHIVVIHDDTVDRTTDGSGPVTNHTLAALQALDAGSWFGARFAGERIPVFDEVLDRYKGRVHIHTEIKGRAPYLSQRTADLVRQHDMVDQVTHHLVPTGTPRRNTCVCSSAGHGLAVARGERRSDRAGQRHRVASDLSAGEHRNDRAGEPPSGRRLCRAGLGRRDRSTDATGRAGGCRWHDGRFPR